LVESKKQKQNEEEKEDMHVMLT